MWRLFKTERIVVGWLEWPFFICLQSQTTNSHGDPRQFLLPYLFSSFALSILTTLDQDPVTDPPKRDWLQERREFCLPSLFCVSQFSSSAPSLLLLSISFGSLLLSVYLVHSAFSLPYLYFLICRVRFENTLVRVLHPQIPACSLLGGY